jgi:hypothetical protein
MKVNYRRGLFSTLAVLTTLMFAGVLVNAQSGRRSTSKSPPSAPPISLPKEEAPKPEKLPRLQLLVGMEALSSFSRMSYRVSSLVFDTCMGRLSEVSEVRVTPVGQNMTRGEAIKMAKAEKEKYVVWLQVADEYQDSAPQTRNSTSDIYVNFIIYEPVTAKIKRTGRTYRGGARVGNVGVGGPPSTRRSPVYSDYQAKESAREAAEKILAAFEIKLGNERWLR